MRGEVMTMANGFALVEIRHKRTQDFRKTRLRRNVETIESIIRNVKGVKKVDELRQRLKGDVHVPTFRFLATVDAADTAGLKRVFTAIDRALHLAGHSHVEGYQA